DTPKAFRKDGKEITNPAWTNNQKIMDAINEKARNVSVRLIASVINFEEAYLNGEINGSKPYSVLTEMATKKGAYDNISKLLYSLIYFDRSLPEGAVEWSQLE